MAPPLLGEGALLDAPLLLGAGALLLGAGALLLVPPVLLAPDFSPACAAGSSLAESLPSLSLSSLAKSFSCGEPFASSREIEPSLFLSRLCNVAAPEALAPEDAEPEVAGEPPELCGWVALGALVVPLGAELLPPDVCAAKGKAKAAATAKAIIRSFIEILLKGVKGLF